MWEWVNVMSRMWTVTKELSAKQSLFVSRGDVEWHAHAFRKSKKLSEGRFDSTFTKVQF